MYDIDNGLSRSALRQGAANIRTAGKLGIGMPFSQGGVEAWQSGGPSRAVKNDVLQRRVRCLSATATMDSEVLTEGRLN